MNRKLAQWLLAGALLSSSVAAKEDDPLVGLWSAYKRFGPVVEGPLRIDARLETAHIGAYEVAVTRNGDELAFELPGDRGRFVGTFGELSKQRMIDGHWVQPPPMQIGQSMASPVRLRRLNTGVWQGKVVTRASEFSFFMPVTEGSRGTLNTFLRNPDRNLGIFANLQRIERDGSALAFLGSYGRSGQEQVIARGSFDPETDVMALQLPPWRGGTYEFVRVPGGYDSAFRARPKALGAWSYRPPPALEDGWSTSTLADVGIDAELIGRMIDKEINTLDDSIHSHRVHGVLIARHGKLVLEEYFHGFDRDVPHDTRSASKSVVSMLVGAAMEAGADLSADTPVFELLRGPADDLEARKKAMTLRHLLTMSSGFYCDDNDSQAPGNENALQEQTGQPDWYQYTLDLPMAMAPGERAVYCSANSNLVGAVLSASTGKSLIALFSELIAKPLGIKRYYLGLQPTGEVYFGGGAHWLPRDFMKIGQVMLNGGTWNGHRVFSEDWSRVSTTEQVKIDGRAYGYQWWITDYPYRDGSVRAFFAAGNGGQIVMGVPELDLIIAFFGGNYSDRVLFRAQEVLVPEYVLMATAPAG